MAPVAHRLIEGALVAAASVAMVYWLTWRTDRAFDLRKSIIMVIITFIAAFMADLLSDKIIALLVDR